MKYASLSRGGRPARPGGSRTSRDRRQLSATGETGQLTVFGKNGRTRAVALPPELWNALNKLRKSAEFGDLVFASRSGQPLDRGRVGSFCDNPPAMQGWWTKPPKSALTGFVTHTLLTPSTTAPRSTWCRPLSDTVRWPLPALICTPDRVIPARGS